MGKHKHKYGSGKTRSCCTVKLRPNDPEYNKLLNQYLDLELEHAKLEAEIAEREADLAVKAAYAAMAEPLPAPVLYQASTPAVDEEEDDDGYFYHAELTKDGGFKSDPLRIPKFKGIEFKAGRGRFHIGVLFD